MQFKAKDFSKREELENEIRSKIGLTPDKKIDIIEGTRKELARLGLSDRTTFYGLSCVITDDPTISKTQKDNQKPERGEIKKFKIQ